MINRDSRGHSRTTAKAFAKDVFINQERKLGARRRSDTVLVSTINDADQGSADVAFRTPLAPYEKSKSLGSGGSMVARLKLKGIDGRAPPGLFLDSMGGGAWPFLVGGAICLVNSVNERDLSLLNSYVEIIAIVGLQRGIPSKRESSARVDYVPALCTHRPSLLPIEWSGEVFGLRRRERFAARDVNVAKCDTWCELQNPVNHRVFERKLRPKPLGRGHACLGVTHRFPNANM
ncbi:hypothetical protein GmHk_U060169 [Glycine max]|nr:hypothetical protein GmHk_U060287 [Glycine max]KAH1188075.1 hypothetical protein GmHk_U060169 [Glycine max]